MIGLGEDLDGYVSISRKLQSCPDSLGACLCRNHGLCSFAALVRERLAHDSVLLEMAHIVQAADIKGELDDHPAARLAVDQPRISAC